MVTYSNLGGYGRLGNQMFQIASTIGVAKDNGLDYGFDSWICKYTSTDFNTFIKNPLKKLIFDYNKKTFNTHESSFSYQKIILDSNFNHILDGYYQSEKYFKNHEKYIKDIFELKSEYKNYILEKYGDKLKDSCSLHIRRGDYVNLQNHHTLIGDDYYKDALLKIYGENINNINLFIFSDDIEWCENNIKYDDFNIIYIKNNLDIIDLNLMSMCDNNIIANSSFSWWGAWLNKNPNKKIVAPKEWFGPQNSHLCTDTLYCEGWVLI
jgi:hypothetical protein